MNGEPDFTKVGGHAVRRVVEAAMIVIATRNAEGLEHRFDESLDALEAALRDVWALKEESAA